MSNKASCLKRISCYLRKRRRENLEAVSPGRSLPLGKTLELSLQDIPSLLGKPLSSLSRRFPPSWENLGALSPGGSLPRGAGAQLVRQSGYDSSTASMCPGVLKGFIHL